MTSHLLTVLLVLAVGATHATEARATFPGQNGMIVFQRNDLQGQEIYVMNADGSGQQALGVGFHPSWSPDGTRIAFTYGGDIWVMNGDGSGRTQITFTPSATDRDPVWSPDGSRIAFASFDGASYDIWVMNAGGGGPVNLTNHPAEDILPSWQPGGEKIAFQTNRNGPTEIYTINSDGTGLSNVSADPDSYDDYPGWSPDGSKIVFARYHNGYDIWVMNADGSAKLQLTTSGSESMPAWSPDGSKIAFGSYRDSNDEIYVMNANGTGAVRLTNNAAPGNTYPEDWFPDWQAIPVPTNRPPDCGHAAASEAVLWPPNHTYQGISILGVTDPDNDPVTITVTGITQDEPVNARGDGNTCPDAQIVNGEASVRAERSSTSGNPGNGRVYAISFTADDGQGGTCTGTVNVCVPYRQGDLACFDDGQDYTSTRPCRSGRELAPESVSLSVARVSASQAEISFGLPAGTQVNVSVYDVIGRRVATIENGSLASGIYSRVWNMDRVSKGLYFVNLHAGAETRTQRVLKTR